ncbi:MAG: hypothetical protein KIT72_08360 [Polyangiaceae bacterium]|nr:hypothetical protein [Polyangiaceae bacterium]MCW5790420.1 hypothetical protein [Polyangiaceae bacterium]
MRRSYWIGRSLSGSLGVLSLAALTWGCDPGKADLDRCIDLRSKGEIEPAMEACRAAVAKSPNSNSGKAAAEQLAELNVEHIASLVREVKRNTSCTQAQIAWAGADAGDKQRLAELRDEACEGLFPKRAGTAEAPSAPSVVDAAVVAPDAGAAAKGDAAPDGAAGE